MFANDDCGSRAPGRMVAVIAIGASALASLVGCGADDSPSALGSYATDSFATPTEHGSLRFDVPNDAVFDQAHRFHSWVFSLTAPADVDLLTELHTTNLDTLMYLYRWQSDALSWGHNIAHNDDHAGSLASRISKSLAAGEYRLKVKGAKTQLAGQFAVVATCSGAGCPVAPGGGCDPDHPAALPLATGLTPASTAQLAKSLTTPVANTLQGSFNYVDRCDQPALVAQSADYYRSFWDAYIGWEAFAHFDADDGPILLETKADFFTNAGSSISIDLGFSHPYGTQLTFVYGPDGQLLAMHRSHGEHDAAMDDIPRALWFGAAAGEPIVDEPGADCLGDALVALPQRGTTSVEQGQGSYVPSDWYDEQLHSHLRAIARLFIEEHGLSNDLPVDYAYSRWQAAGEWYGNRVEFTKNGTSTSYLAGDSSKIDEAAWVFFRIEDQVTSFVCQERY